MKRLYFFLSLIALLTGLTACRSESNPAPAAEPGVPSYLADRAAAFAEAPRTTNLAWFEEADYGLFIHYGLYSLLERGEWVQLRDTIPVADYARLVDDFTAASFDADAITDLALQAGMKYITITAKHHDGFSLFETQASGFHAMNSPAQRDLIRELYEACEAKGLALFLYYSYAADWKHPYFYGRENGWKNARPAYEQPQPEYQFEEEADFQRYIDFAHEQLTELLTQYPHIAGIWLDPIMGFYSRPDLFPVDSTYALIRRLSPHALISFKQGANGTEDFVAPERKGAARVGQQFEVARRVYELNQGKKREICNTLQPHAWGYHRQHEGEHKTAEEVVALRQEALDLGANLLLNVGPKGDGGFPQEDIDALLQAQRLWQARQP